MIKVIFVYLHSTVVLLKVNAIKSVTTRVWKFTFYCSSIKSLKMVLLSMGLEIFTFYCSSIKSFSSNAKSNSSLKFTFYCSSIKRFTAEMHLEDNLDLHSTVVLLKDTKQHDARYKFSHLHSTVVLLKVSSKNCI